MPYICLANANLPGGVLQITDLWPNESQRNGAIDPPGQNRYLSRPNNDNIGLSGAGPISVVGLTTSAGKPVLEGLGAYIADVVEPGATQAATGTVQMVGPLVGDILTFRGPGGVLTQVFTAVEHNATGTVTVVSPVAGVAQLTLGTINFSCVENKATGGKFVPGAVVNVDDTFTIAGVVFTAKGAENIPLLQFDQSSGVANTIATSMRAVINGAAAQLALTAALDALVAVPTGGTMAAGGALDQVELTPSLNGTWGQAVLAESTAGVRIAKTDFTAPVGANASANPPEFASYAQYVGGTVAARQSAVATSLAAAINSAATIALMDAANAGPVPTADFGHMTAIANVVAGRVDLTASQVGFSGQLGVATAQVVNLAISGAALGGIAANAGAFEFDTLLNASTNVLAATSLAAVLNNAATDVALGTTIGGSTVTAANGGTDTVTITADTAGSVGAMRITPSSAVRTAVSANALAKTMVAWTATQINLAVAAVQALVDAGSPCTAAGLNAAINGVAGVSGVSVAVGGASSVADILSILAGRVYQLPADTVKDPTGKNWDAATPAGSFTDPNIVFDTGMLSGEWGATASGQKWIKTSGGNSKPVFSGGDTVQNEIGGIRTTVDSTHFASSLATGQLAHYAAGISLFPDADVQVFVSDWTRRTNRQATLNNQRVVTVYADDGSVMA